MLEPQAQFCFQKETRKENSLDANINFQVVKFRIVRVFSLVLLFYPVKQWDLFTHQTQLRSTWLFGKFENFQLQSPTKVYSSAIIAAIKTHILLKDFSVWCFYKQHSHKQTQSGRQEWEMEIWKWAFRLEEGSGRGIPISEKQTLCMTYT